MSREEPQESPLSRMGGRVAGEGRSEGENVDSRFQVAPDRSEAQAGGTQVAPDRSEAGTEGGASGGHRPTNARGFTKRPKPKERRRIGFFMPRLLPWSSPVSGSNPKC